MRKMKTTDQEKMEQLKNSMECNTKSVIIALGIVLLSAYMQLCHFRQLSFIFNEMIEYSIVLLLERVCWHCAILLQCEVTGHLEINLQKITDNKNYLIQCIKGTILSQSTGHGIGVLAIIIINL